MANSSLAVLQESQKGSVNQIEIVVVKRYRWLKMHAVSHTGGQSRSSKSLFEIMHSASSGKEEKVQLI